MAGEACSPFVVLRRFLLCVSLAGRRWAAGRAVLLNAVGSYGRDH